MDTMPAKDVVRWLNQVSRVFVWAQLTDKKGFYLEVQKDVAAVRLNSLPGDLGVVAFIQDNIVWLG